MSQPDVASASEPNAPIQTMTHIWARLTDGLSTDVTGSPVWLLIIVVGVIAFAYSFTKFTLLGRRLILDEPVSMPAFLWATMSSHLGEYVFLCLVPLGLAVALKKNILGYFGIWGFLITTIGAFYATRAAYSSRKAFESSNKALESSNKALEQITQIVKFSDSLEQFDRNIRYAVERLSNIANISIRFLSVIPAFGTVGLEEYYARQHAINPNFEHLSRFLYDMVLKQMLSGNRWNLEILTHNDNHTRAWIKRISSFTETHEQRLREKVNGLCQAQTDFVRHYLQGEVGSGYVRMRTWDASQLPVQIHIPFQLLIIKDYMEFTEEDNLVNADTQDIVRARADIQTRRVYFLFSGDFLYRAVFKLLGNDVVDMHKFQLFTKGYYTEDPELLPVFNNTYWNFARRMPLRTTL